MGQMQVFLAISLFVAVVILLPIAMVRGLVEIYRDKNRSGGISGAVGGMMTELDRVVRPSAQHVIEVKESARSKEDDIGSD